MSGISKFVALDLETTGLDKENDRIIEVGLVVFEDGEIVEEKDALIYSEGLWIPDKVSELTGIRLEEVKKRGVPLHEFFKECDEEIFHLPVVGHSVEFDLEFLRREGFFTETPRVYDTFKLAVFLFDLPQYTLSEVAKKLGVTLEHAHRASEDAKAAGNVFLKMVEYARSQLPPELRTAILSVLPEGSSLRDVLGESPNTLVPFPDFLGVEEWRSGGKREQKVVVERVREEEVKVAFSKVKESMEGFEEREEQLEFAKFVTDGLNEGGVYFVEAGTGVGKTLSYLIPSAIFALKNERQVVVSTSTKVLQDQLQKRELPILTKVFPGLRVGFLKGRENYVCLRKLWEVSTSRKYEGAAFILSLLWRRRKGELEEIPSVAYLCFQDLPQVVARVRSSRLRCRRKECPFYRKCFYFRNSVGARSAHILVVNHALLFSKEEVRSEDVIVDEAHNFVRAGENWLITRFSTSYSIGLLEESLNKFSKFLPGEFESSGSHLKWALSGVHECFAKKKLEHPVYVLTENEEALLESLALKWEKFIETFDEKSVGDEAGWDAEFYKDALLEQLENLKGFLSLGEGEIRWVERCRNGVCFCTSPVSVESYVGELVSSFRFALFTSATLVAGDEFAYFKSSLGYNGDVRTLVLGSPYDWEGRVRFFFVKDINPQHKSDPQLVKFYREKLFDMLKSAIRGSDGGVLILFTSTSEMQRAYRELTSDVEMKKKYRILQQGRDSRRMILSYFEQYDNVVALGTKSFWEGIDVRGTGLRCVVITSLPFPFKYDPVLNYRVSALKKKEDDSWFTDVILPKTVLQFKQGVGRLLRSKKDYGAVVVLDERIVEKEYGKRFLTPRYNYVIVEGGAKSLEEELKKWFEKWRGEEDGRNQEEES